MTTANDTPKALPCPKCGRMPRASLGISMVTLSCYGAQWVPFAAHLEAWSDVGADGGGVDNAIDRWNSRVRNANRLREALKP